jgi:hypothetical protein
MKPFGQVNEHHTPTHHFTNFLSYAHGSPKPLQATTPECHSPLDNGTGGSDDASHDSDDCDAVFIDIDNIIYNDNPQKPWDPSRPPETLDLTKPLPNEELYPDGKRYAGQGPVQFTAFQRECLRGNRFFNSRPRTKAQQVTYLLSVYKNMAAKMIHLAYMLDRYNSSR